MTLVDLLVRPVAYHPALARLLGSVPAAVMLSQSIYWQQRVPVSRPAGCPGKGWWYHTSDEWEVETALSEGMQLTARKILRKTSFWFEKAAGMPRRMWFRVDLEELEKLLTNQQSPGSRGTSIRQCREQDGRFTGNMVSGTPGTLHTEITAEMTTETTTSEGLETAEQGGGFSAIRKTDTSDSVQAEYLDLLKVFGDARSYLALSATKKRQWAEKGGLSDRDQEQLSVWRKANSISTRKISKLKDLQAKDLKFAELAEANFEKNLELLPAGIRAVIEGKSKKSVNS